MSQIADRVYRLKGYGPDGRKDMAVVILPEPIEADKVSIAWAYALRHTAKGLDKPDYEAASQLMMQRHPGWVVAATHRDLVYRVSANFRKADDDVPESD